MTAVPIATGTGAGKPGPVIVTFACHTVATRNAYAPFTSYPCVTAGSSRSPGPPATAIDLSPASKRYSVRVATPVTVYPPRLTATCIVPGPPDHSHVGRPTTPSSVGLTPTAGAGRPT